MSDIGAPSLASHFRVRHEKTESRFLCRLLRQVHHDERGALGLEAVLIIAVIALPVLIVLYKFAWRAIKTDFYSGLEEVGVDVQQ